MLKRLAMCRSSWRTWVISASSSPVPDSALLIAEADKALYQSKSRGRDRVTHHLDMLPALAEGGLVRSTAP